MLASDHVYRKSASSLKNDASVDKEKKDSVINVPLSETTVDESHTMTVGVNQPIRPTRKTRKFVTSKEEQPFIEHDPKEEQKTQVIPFVKQYEIVKKQHLEVFRTDVNEIKRLYQKNPCIIAQYIIPFLFSVLVAIIVCLTIYIIHISQNITSSSHITNPSFVITNGTNMTSQVNTTLGVLNETTMHNIGSFTKEISSSTTSMSDYSPSTVLAPIYETTMHNIGSFTKEISSSTTSMSDYSPSTVLAPIYETTSAYRSNSQQLN